MAVKDKFKNNLENTSPMNPTTDSPKSKFSKNLNNEVGIRSMGFTADGGINPVGNTGIGESQFDYRIPESEIQNLSLIRATRQPWTHQAGNAILGGITSGALTAIEDVGYILDLPNNIKSSIYSDVIGNRVENVESNWLSDWAKDNKEALNAALPIYRKDPSDTFDWNDSGFYFDMLKGVLDSAIGFGAVGMGSGALVKGLGKGIRALSKMGDVNKLNAYMNITGKAIQQGKVGNASAAYITNFGESKMMALELYDEARNNVESELIKQHQEIYGVAPEGKELQSIQLKASDIAGKEANTFMLRNKMFMLTDYMQLGSIFKTQSLTRDLISKPGFKTFAKNQLKTAPKEALEEIGQNVLQMEGKYQAEQELDKQFGIKVDEAISNETNWVNRFIEFGTSDQALLEGMMGLISGPIQYGITTAPFTNTKEENKRYTNQQQTLAKNKEYFDTKAKVITDKTKAIEEAVANGQYEIADLIEQKQFDSLLLENFQRGTTEQLESGLTEMLQQEDTTPEIKEKITKSLERLTELENEYNTNFRKYSNGVEVYHNRLQVRHDKKGLELLNQNNERFIQDLTDELSIPIESHNKTKQGKENPVSFSEVLELIKTGNNEELNKLPSSIKQIVAKSANAQRVFLTTSKNIPAIEKRIVETNNEYNDAVTTPYQLGYERMQDIIENFKTTEEKITELNKLEKDVKATKNDTLINRVKRERATLEANVQAAKDADAQGNKEPETIKAEANTKKPATKTPVTTPVVETKPTITPEDKQQVDIVRRANIMAAKLAADNEALAQIEALTDEEFLADIKANPDLVQAAQQQLDEWANISAEEKEAIKNGIKPITLGEEPQLQTPEVTEQPVTETPLEAIPAEELFADDTPQTELPQVETPVISVEPISQVKEEIQINENPNSPEVEVRNYNTETNTTHEDLNKEDNTTVDKFEQSHVKISNPPRSKNLSQEALNFLDWLENGVNPTGSLVEYQASTGISPANRTAFNTFTKLQRGEQVSTEDKKFMVDNLSISLNPQGINNAKTFLFDVREGKTEDSKRAAKLERKLRTQIIANLLAGVIPTSTVVAQYGGDLKVTETDVPITDIPDFRNMKADDIQFMYVNGEGNLMDANTREITTNPKFINKKITLNSTGEAMKGAIFTIVRKANGDQFPLKLNIKELSTKEIDLVTQLLMDIVTVNGGKQNNILAKPVEDSLLGMMDVNDRNYLSENGKKTITYSMALSHLVYEGDRSKSNLVTQLLFKNGKVIFGNQELTLDNFLETQSKLKEFLAQYKTRNIDLRKMSNDINYKRHVINNGLLTTNTDTATSKATLFESLDLQANYKSVGERMTNRYKSATIYVEPQVSNPITPKSKTDTTLKSNIKPIPETIQIKVEFKEPDLSFANTKLEQFEQVLLDGSKRILKGYNILIKGQPNTKLFVHRETEGSEKGNWVVIDKSTSMKFPLNKFGGSVGSKSEVLSSLTNSLNEIITLPSNFKVLESIGFNITQSKPVLEVSPEVSSIVSELAVDPIQEAANAKLEENKENMTVSNIITAKRDASEVSDKLNKALGNIGKNKKKAADKNDPNKKCDQ